MIENAVYAVIISAGLYAAGLGETATWASAVVLFCILTGLDRWMRSR